MMLPKVLPSLLIAGLAGEIAFEIYAFGVSPWVFGLALEPANLVNGLLARHLGVDLPYSAAFALHVLVGAVLFPLLYLALRRFGPLRSPVANGLLLGLALWLVAQGLLAPLVGRPPFMGFGAYTWSSLVAHPLLTVVVAIVFERATAVRAPRPAPLGE